MSKVEKQTRIAYLNDERLEIKWTKKGKDLVEFSINFTIEFESKRIPVYRVDNHHGYLHEQKLWRDERPIPIYGFENWSAKAVFDHFFEECKLNCLKFKKFMIEKLQRK